MLYIVGTPIGNLGDMSQRAIDTLRNAALILAEDTRVTSKLCAKFEIKTKLVSYHKFNERERSEEIVARLVSEDISIALVTDAGMPGISDPGTVIVNAARAAGVTISVVPGSTAESAAISLTGWNETSYAFYGFMPKENAALKSELARVSKLNPVAVLYESPHRIAHLLKCISDVPNASRVLVCNDLTKLHEWVFEGTPDEVLDAITTKKNVEKGEYCVAIRFAPVEPEAAPSTVSPEAYIIEAMMNGASLSEAFDLLKSTGVSRNEAYQAKLRVREFLDGGHMTGGRRSLTGWS